MIPVVVFNADVLTVMVSINGGPASRIGGTSEGLDWAPIPLSSIVQMTTSGSAAANVLALGRNSATITPQNVALPYEFEIDLPASGLQWTNIQLYLFFDSYGAVGWSLLNQGAFVTGAICSS